MQSWGRGSRAGGIRDFRLYYSNQYNMVLASNRNTNQYNRIESPEINPHTYGYLIYDKGGQNIQWSKDNLFNKWS